MVSSGSTAIDVVGIAPIAMDGSAMDGTSSRGGASASTFDGAPAGRGGVAIVLRETTDSARGRTASG